MQKHFLILVVSGIFMVSGALAQKTAIKNTSQELLITLPDTSNKYFFNKHPALKSIDVLYKNNQPYAVFLNFENERDNHDRREHYDLAFEGDAYVLQQKYGVIHLKSPMARLRSGGGRNATNVVFGITVASINKDSILYRGRQQLSDGTIEGYNPDWVTGAPARYTGEMKFVENRIARKFAEAEPTTPVDSIVVFRGTVSKQGHLSDMELIAGKQSDFSDLVRADFLLPRDELGLLPPRRDWRPAIISRGGIDTKFNIYARLNKDGSVTIKTPRRLRTFR
jgi:hypothetical protein